MNFFLDSLCEVDHELDFRISALDTLVLQNKICTSFSSCLPCDRIILSLSIFVLLNDRCILISLGLVHDFHEGPQSCAIFRNEIHRRG